MRCAATEGGSFSACSGCRSQERKEGARWQCTSVRSTGWGLSSRVSGSRPWWAGSPRTTPVSCPTLSLEERLTVQAREMTRMLLQDHLDLRAVREERLSEVSGADGVTLYGAKTRLRIVSWGFGGSVRRP